MHAAESQLRCCRAADSRCALCPAAAEFSLVRNAFFTDPRDQSCWLYHRWLLSRVVAQLPQMPSLLIAFGQADEQQSAASSPPPSAPAPSSPPVQPLAVFDRELIMCRELDAVEANCKWTLLTIALLLAGREAVSQAQQQLQQQSDTAASVTAAACTLPPDVVIRAGCPVPAPDCP